MAHSLSSVTPISRFSRCTNHLPSPAVLKVCACSTTTSLGHVVDERHVERRTIALGLVGAVLGLSVGGGSARAGARRPPPPPPTEKKDPNMSGVTAKVLASKKRKEAMKESIAKLRERGKTIQEPAQ